MASSKKNTEKTPAVVVCRECNKEKMDDYQTIETKRKTKIYICNDCVEKMRNEAQRARDSK